MAQVDMIVLALLVAFAAFSVRNGTWCASDRCDDRSQFPGPYANRRH
ncbi:hypothetical protein DSM104299_03417 [Baekduia alba]|nr:hypothetical protein [Baekduia alba]WCB94679.1 hypothetical protein DSM104299_03417 [Baekduia alba]